MSDNIEYPKNRSNGRAMAGIIIVGIGCMLLLREFDFFFIPGWLFSWPMWLIAWGLYIGAKHNFRNSSGIMLMLVGVAFLINENIDHASRVVWPSVFIIAGIWMILRKNRNWDNKTNWGKRWEDKWDSSKYNNGNPFDPITPDPSAADTTTTDPATGTVPPTGNPYTNPLSGDDILDTVSIFGGVNKTILSKKFRGGDIVNIFGGTELDFTQADINGRVIIDITQIFGGTKIIIPSNWQVVSDIAAVFASVDDKRMKNSKLDDNKVLVLKGVSLFAGIDIRSY
jgi:predicted membrane protein